MNASSISLRQLLTLAALATGPASLHAADIQWAAATGDYGAAANWQGGVVPAAGDAAFLENGGTLNLTDDRSVLQLHLRSGTFVHQPAAALEPPPAAQPSSMLTNTVGMWVGQGAGRNATYELDGGLTFLSADFEFGTGGGEGQFTFINGFVSKSGSVPLKVGSGSDGSGRIEQSSGLLNCGSPMVFGDGAGATGSYLGQQTSAVVAGDEVVFGVNGGTGEFELSGNAAFTLSSPAVEKPVASFGRGAGSTATVQQSGGRFVNNASITYLGESGNATATWTLSGPTSAEAVFLQLELAHADSATGTFNLNGGTLQVGRITAGDSTGASILNLNGGVLKPLASSSDLISGLTAVRIGEGGVIIDTKPSEQGSQFFDVEIPQDLLDAGGGGLIKRSEGILILSGACSYTGDTTVQGGSLLINGSLTASPVVVGQDGTLGGTGTLGSTVVVLGKVLAGDFGGTLTVNSDVDVQGSLVAEISGSGANLLLATGNLNISTARLEVNLDGLPTAGAKVIARYGSLTGASFAGIEGLPSGYSIDYAYQGNQIAIIGSPSAYALWSAQQSWPQTEDSLPEADPDGDGVANALEFMIGANPLFPTEATALPAGVVVHNAALQADRFHFTFRRAEAAQTVPPVIEFSSDLSTWSTAQDGVAGVIVAAAEEGGDELWTVSFPLTTQKLFARLKVAIP